MRRSRSCRDGSRGIMRWLARTRTCRGWQMGRGRIVEGFLGLYISPGSCQGLVVFSKFASVAYPHFLFTRCSTLPHLLCRGLRHFSPSPHSSVLTLILLRSEIIGEADRGSSSSEKEVSITLEISPGPLENATQSETYKNSFLLSYGEIPPVSVSWSYILRGWADV